MVTFSMTDDDNTTLGGGGRGEGGAIGTMEVAYSLVLCLSTDGGKVLHSIKDISTKDENKLE